MTILNQVLNGFIQFIAWLLSLIVAVLKWSHDQINGLAGYPQSNLPGIKWFVWLIAMLAIILSLFWALYRFVPHIKGVLTPLWAAIKTLRPEQIPRIIAVIIGSMVVWFVASGIWSWVVRLVLSVIPKF